MLRIALVVAMLAVTIYAAADWHRTPEDEMPGKIAKPIWLMIILFTATIAAIGPLAWLVLRWVSRAEKAQRKQAEAPKRPSAPDDDPEFLFRLERDIQRKRREEERREQERRKRSEGEDSDPTAAASDEAN
ncbi:MAG: phospholipase [Schaalia odontolytica]